MAVKHVCANHYAPPRCLDVLHRPQPGPAGCWRLRASLRLCGVETLGFEQAFKAFVLPSCSKKWMVWAFIKDLKQPYSLPPLHGCYKVVSLDDSWGNDPESPVEKDYLCPHSKATEGCFQLPLPRGSIPRTQLSLLPTGAPREMGWGGLQGRVKNGHLHPQQGREVGRRELSSLLQPPLSSPMGKKKSSKGTGGFFCTSYAPVKFSSIVLLVLDQVQTLYGQSLCCVSVWVIH